MIDPEEAAVEQAFEALDVFSFDRETDSPRMKGKLSVLDLIDIVDYTSDHKPQSPEQMISPIKNAKELARIESLRQRQDNVQNILDNIND